MNAAKGSDESGANRPPVPTPPPPSPPPAPPVGRFAPGELQLVPLAPPPAPKPRRRRRGVGIVGVAVVLLLIAGGVSAVLVARRHHGPRYPKAWDPRVAPLAAEAAKLRHLNFLHPVYVEFLTPAQYTKETTTSASDLSADDRADMANTVAEARALGVLQGSPDLARDANELNDNGTAAFYNDQDKKIYVRGTKMTVDLKVTLVHELTHVLQDQHFDLDATFKRIDALPDSDDVGFRALVEGDAVTVQQEYVDTLSAADKKAYEAQDDAASSKATKQLADVPKVFQDLSGEPYEFGPTFVAVLKDEGGEKAVDAAFRKPPTTFLPIWNPVLYLQHANPAPVPAPELPAGAKRFDHSPLGVYAGYLMLAERIPPLQALDAVDTWRSDDELSYRTKSGQVCVDTRVRGADAAGSDAIAAAFTAWAKKMPAAAAAKVTRAANRDVLVHSCDPGPKADLHVTDQGDSALAYPVLRASFAQALLDDPSNDGTFTTAVAYCLGNDAVHTFPISVLTSDGDLTSAQEQKLQDDAVACMVANKGDD